jgi:multidrug efflux pump subunit AcrA (membrane-fusion protein)
MFVVFVQVEGEAFERRVLELGVRSGGWVAVLAGLAAGDRLVVRGAYDVELAAGGGAVPSHGHAH